MEQITGISNGSVRRLLAIPGYENITVELPLSGTSDVDFWNTVKRVDERLLEWVLYINSGRTVAAGKSAFDQLTAELSYVNGRIQQLVDQGKTITKG
jgi:hypothetical protein